MPKQRCECGATIRFDESAVGKRAKCPKCGAVITLANDAPGPIPLAPVEEPRAAPTHDTFARAGRDGEATAAHDADEGLDPRLHTRDRHSAPRARRGYARDLLESFVLPVRPNNLPAFLVVWAILAVGAALAMLGPVLMLLRLGIAGWFCAFRLAIVRHTTADDDDLPPLSLHGGIWEDVLRPLLQWVGCWVCALTPAVIGLKLAVGTGSSAAKALQVMLNGGIAGVFASGIVGEAALFSVLLAFGLLIWPLMILCTAVEGFTTIFRVDLLVMTIARAPGAYVLTVAVVFAADFTKSLTDSLVARAWWPLLAAGAALYLEIVAMRVIGLFYRHFKSRFVWSWE